MLNTSSSAEVANFCRSDNHATMDTLGLNVSHVHYILPSLKMLTSSDLLFCLQNMPRLASHPSLLQYFDFVAHFLQELLKVFFSRAKSKLLSLQVLHNLALHVSPTSPKWIPPHSMKNLCICTLSCLLSSSFHVQCTLFIIPTWLQVTEKGCQVLSDNQDSLVTELWFSSP